MSELQGNENKFYGEISELLRQARAVVSPAEFAIRRLRV